MAADALGDMYTAHEKLLLSDGGTCRIYVEIDDGKQVAVSASETDRDGRNGGTSADAYSEAISMQSA